MEAVKKRYEHKKRQKSVITRTANMTNTFNITLFKYVHVCMCTLVYNDFSYPDFSYPDTFRSQPVRITDILLYVLLCLVLFNQQQKHENNNVNCLSMTSILIENHQDISPQKFPVYS